MRGGGEEREGERNRQWRWKRCERENGYRIWEGSTE